MTSTLLLVFHGLFVFLAILLVLMQPSKDGGIGPGAGMMIGMEGASRTFFGSRGSGSFMTKLTGFVIFCFFGTSLALGLYAPSSIEKTDALFAKENTLTANTQKN